MQCAACGVESREARASEEPFGSAGCESCGESPLLDGRYRLDEVLARGGQGTTHAATRLQDGLRVVAKELPLRAVDDWSTVERFRREAAVLRQLEHPDIPRLLDELETGSGRARAVWLVQERVEGMSLERELERRRYSEAEVLEVVGRAAEVLAYLHERRPPVIHRDVKPANLVRREGDGGLSLVDFGAVRDAPADAALGGRTVIGTFGYMAPEQLRGDAFPASDVYGLGATALRLLTREEPGQLIGFDGRVKAEALRDLTPRTRQLLERMLAPDPADRLPDGAAVQAALDVPDIRDVPDVAEDPRPHVTAPARRRRRPSSRVAPVEVGRAVSEAARQLRGARLAAPAGARRSRSGPAAHELMTMVGVALIIGGFVLGLGFKVGMVGVIATVVAGKLKKAHGRRPLLRDPERRASRAPSARTG